MPESTPRHILSEFDVALDSLRDNLLMMASLTQRNLDRARTGLLLRDEDHCNTAIADDEQIDLLETQMDSEGMSLLVRFQPLASDLRVVIATMKISVNLERISDLAVNIARRARKLIALSTIPHMELISVARCLEQIASLCANISEDTELAFSKRPIEPKGISLE